MTAAINSFDGSTLGNKLITSHQVDYMSSVLIPAEAVENAQEHITSSSNKVGSRYHTIILVTLCAEKPKLCLKS